MSDLAAAPPVAAPAAAPAASSPTPAAPSTPAAPPSTPATPAAPPTTTPETPAAPATPAAEKPPKPKVEDFGSDVESFVRAEMNWEREHGEGALPVEEPAAPAAEAPAEPETPAATEEQPTVEPQELEPEVQTTPEALAKMEIEHPELKSLFEAKPEIKGVFYKMARENAKMAPIAEIFPDVDSAKFAAETARSTVDIRNGFIRAADEPELLDDAFESFVDLFREVDDKGQPIMDEHGYPKIGKDFEMIGNKFVDGYHDGELALVEERLKADKYPNENARDKDHAYAEAIKYIKDYKDASATDMQRPDLSSLTPEARAYIEQKEAEVQAERDKVAGREKTQTAQERKAARSTHETKVRTAVAEEFGERLSAMTTEMLAKNVYIPRFALEMKNPSNGVSFFAESVYNTFLEKTVGRPVRDAGGKITWVGGVAKHRNDLAALEAQPPGEASAKQRVEFFRGLREQYLPGIFDAEVRKLQKSAKLDREAREKKDDAARAEVGTEPRGGGTPKPATMTAELAMQQARANVDKMPGAENMSAADRLEAELKEYQRLAP